MRRKTVLQHLSCSGQCLPGLPFRINLVSLLSKSLLFDCFVIFASLIVEYSLRHPWLPFTITWVALKVVILIKILMPRSQPNYPDLRGLGWVPGISNFQNVLR